MGKAEGQFDNWHGHVTALTVSPDYRRLGLAVQLMNFLEDVSEKYIFIKYPCFFLSNQNHHFYKENALILWICLYGKVIQWP